VFSYLTQSYQRRRRQQHKLVMPSSDKTMKVVGSGMGDDVTLKGSCRTTLSKAAQ
jgi:hypothetical protein